MKMKNMIKKLALIGTMALGTLALAQASDTQTLSINVDTLEELVVVAGKTQSDSLTDPEVIKAGNYQKDFDTTLRFTTNANALRKVVAAASFSAPQGATLQASILATGFSTQAGTGPTQDVPLSTSPADLITGIKNVSAKEASFKVRVSIPDTPIIAGAYQVVITYTLMAQ
jgi:hypothetical protein